MKLNGRMIDCPEGAQRGLSSDGSADRMNVNKSRLSVGSRVMSH